MTVNKVCLSKSLSLSVLGGNNLNLYFVAYYVRMKLNFNLFKKNKKNEVFKCKHCKMTFKEKEKLDVHSKKAHTGREKPDRPH